MKKIIINRLGPVKFCELEINDFTVFTGPQASGKSTIAKSIFFFKNMKNILYSQYRKNSYLVNISEDEMFRLSLKKRIEREIRSNFLQIFGTTWHMDMDMYLQYFFNEDTYVKVSLVENMSSPNYIWIDFSSNLGKFIEELQVLMRKNNLQIDNENLACIRERINKFFGDDSEIVYIPAGRSMITLLSTQLNYIYSSMDDTQKKNLDYCTQNYLERILQLKPSFSSSAVQMIRDTLQLTDLMVNKSLMYSLAEIMKNILQGEYRNINGEERLQVSREQYVKINFASSGQQEVVWILNVIFYYLLNNRKTFFIIEEPESHLFPNAQKLIAEFISMAKSNGKNQVFITTHSPYILGTINNLLYADKISAMVDETELEKIVSKDKWISFSQLSAYFIDNGKVTSCMDDEFAAIENEVIDGASEDINKDYEAMVLLKERFLSKGE